MVVRLFPEQNYGFIEMDNSPELYFTRNAVDGGDFAELKVGMMVQVTRATEEGPMGPQASSVRLLDRGSEFPTWESWLGGHKFPVPVRDSGPLIPVSSCFPTTFPA